MAKTALEMLGDPLGPALLLGLVWNVYALIMSSTSSESC